MIKTKWQLYLLALLSFQGSLKADTAVEGVRAGLLAGYGLIDSKVNSSRVSPSTVTDSSDISGRGVVGGVAFDWSSLIGNSNTLMGAELSFNFLTAKGKKSTQGTFLTGPNTADLSTSVFFRRAFDLAGKIGILFTDSALAYFKVGPSLGRWKASSVSNAYVASGSSSANILGFVAGIGAEFPLSERLSAGAEFNYRSYKSFTHVLSCCGGTPLRNIAVNPTASSVMLRLSYKLSAIDFATTPPKKERKRKRSRRPNPG